MPDRSPDRAIDGLARRQHGAFHRRQAVRLGFTDRMIERRLRTGAWVRLRDSQVFALPSHPGSWLRQGMAATLSVPVSGLSGPAGAALRGFPGWPRAALEVTTRYGTTTRSPFATVRRSRTVGRLVVVEGIRTVARADCLVQLAPLLGVDGLGGLVDELARTDPRVLDELRDRYVDLARSRVAGIGHLRAVLDERGDGWVPPASELQRRLAALLDTVPGMPAVEWEATPPWLEAVDGRVDALVPAWRLVVEGDGRAWHTRVADFERDRWRDNLALAHDHVTLRFSWRQITAAPVACRNLLVAVGARRVCPPPPVRAA